MSIFGLILLLSSIEISLTATKVSLLLVFVVVDDSEGGCGVYCVTVGVERPSYPDPGPTNLHFRHFDAFPPLNTLLIPPT